MLYLSILFIGLFIGTLCRKVPAFKKLDSSISYTIWAMLFIFGITIGSNQSLVENVGNIGLQAFVIAAFGILGSALAARLAYQLFFNSKKGGNHEK